jgi:IS30 family transposase
MTLRFSRKYAIHSGSSSTPEPFKVYFCDPRSPWERPSNENTNGLIREFFPKGTRFSEVTDEEVERAQRLLNERPRKVLGWKFPVEAMQEVLKVGATIG